MSTGVTAESNAPLSSQCEIGYKKVTRQRLVPERLGLSTAVCSFASSQGTVGNTPILNPADNFFSV